MSQKVPLSSSSSNSSNSWHVLLISLMAIGLSIMSSIKILNLETRLLELESKCTVYETIIATQSEELKHMIPQLREELQSLSDPTSWVCAVLSLFLFFLLLTPVVFGRNFPPSSSSFHLRFQFTFSLLPLFWSLSLLCEGLTSPETICIYRIAFSWCCFPSSPSFSDIYSFFSSFLISHPVSFSHPFLDPFWNISFSSLFYAQ